MGRPQVSYAKRQREQAKKDKRAQKAEKRAQRKAEPLMSADDPSIASGAQLDIQEPPTEEEAAAVDRTGAV